MKKITCKSGIIGNRCRLRDNYTDINEFLHYDAIYNLSKRLKYSSPIKAWEFNPVIEFSTNPADFRKI